MNCRWRHCPWKHAIRVGVDPLAPGPLQRIASPRVWAAVFVLFYLGLSGFGLGCLWPDSIGCGSSPAWAEEALVPRALQAKITHVQPWTGLVLWTTSEHVTTDAIQLEYSYLGYDASSPGAGEWDFSALEGLLAKVASRGHQAIIRPHYVYPGQPTKVPDWIKALPDYHERQANSEGKPTGFPDWSHPALVQFTKDYFTELFRRFDGDPRLAYVELGFGLWGEYHIYDGPFELGRTFPDFDTQRDILTHVAAQAQQTPWMISVDAVDDRVSPLDSVPGLLELPFGVFDDSFLCRQHAWENAVNWREMDLTRWQRAPTGGEFSYYTTHDQREALAAEGPHGTSFAQMGREFHITFMIANDQPRYVPLSRVREASLWCGSRFRVTALASNDRQTRLSVTNEGIAPAYFDVWVEVNGVRAEGTLRGLLPGEVREFEADSGGAEPRVRLTSNRLVPGQEIEFAADLPGRE